MPLDVEDARCNIHDRAEKFALVRQYQKFFEMENADLEFTPEALVEIATKAKAKDTGARGLRAIVEDIMLDIMYDLPDRSTKEKTKFLVTPDVVLKKKSLFESTVPVPPAAKTAAERKKESA